VVALDDSNKLSAAVAQRIDELKKTDYINYIIIFKNLQHLNAFKDSEYCIKASKDKNCIVFDNFNSNFP
jgi:hypothetical protein